MTPIINAKNLRKIYRIKRQHPGAWNAVKSIFFPDYEQRVAVDDIDFSLDEGCLAALVGPNGAGKSTLIKMLVGVLRRDAGDLDVMGLDPFNHRMRYVRNIGVVFGQRTNLLWDLSVQDSFELHRAVFGIPRRDFLCRLDELRALFNLDEILRQPARTLSLGQTMRADVAQVLLQQPKILFLDEPTIGLDVLSVKSLIAALRKVNSLYATTIVVTSHDLTVIEELCSNVVLLDKGRVIFDGTVNKAVDTYGNYRKLRFQFTHEQNLAMALELIAGAMPKMLQRIATRRESLELSTVLASDDVDFARLLELAQRLRDESGLREFSMEKPTLKEVILHVFS
ncbi:ABC transporter ATP-binding protein [Desulfobulbus alkaliphilus]|uniref:ABC transporter ATP-binding protein n=1 Tax=Desulfobulbus alkaliphilus TaxID=869814 RepID=UPI00196677B0|nr:ATP-binding cassette domain-containing protein [Desulfobulbus alkaliphilus]MBM9535993.1 ATP-binding cassette domain-containing protein [Desulfobulbus alkaliphilus]